MSNSNWDESFQDSQEESQEHIPGKKYVKKWREPRGKNGKQISPANKKKKCQFYNRGACMKGPQCPFTHSFIPDVAKRICKLFIKDTCSKGEACPYSHNTKRYPCKSYHINQSCYLKDQCPFSHQQIDPDFEEQFLRDNEQFLISAHKSKKKLPKNYKQYFQKNDLLNENRKREIVPVDGPVSLLFLFGLHTYQTVSRQSRIPANSKKTSELKKSSKNEMPFIIRLVTKNREQIPEKLGDMVNENEENSHEQSCSDSVKSSSEFQKNQLQVPISDKTSQGAKRPNKSKSSRLDHEQMYTFN